MKSKSSIYGAVLLVFSVAVGVAYAHFDALQAALADANASVHGARGPAGDGKDALGCHRHGATTYHCH